MQRGRKGLDVSASLVSAVLSARGGILRYARESDRARRDRQAREPVHKQRAAAVRSVSTLERVGFTA